MHSMTPAAFAASCPSAVDGDRCVPKGEAKLDPEEHALNATVESGGMDP
jgi:hypothetical protein